MVKVPEYKFLELLGETNETCPIQILDGKYKDIVYRYGKISLKEVENENLQVNMDIDMVVCPEGFDQQEPEFTQLIGEIFVDIIEKNMASIKDPVDLEDDVHQD
jgi:hypothetical protein